MSDEKITRGIEFKNESKYSFVNISSELYREYRFSGGEIVRIDEPLYLSVSKNGHRVFDSSGKSHYIPLGWIQLSWEVRKGKPNFVA